MGALVDPQFVQLDFLETIRDARIDIDKLASMNADHIRSSLIKLQTNQEARTYISGAARAKDDEERERNTKQFQLLLDKAIEETDPIVKFREEYNRKIGLLQKHLRLRDERITELEDRLSLTESTWIYQTLAWIRRLFKKSEN